MSWTGKIRNSRMKKKAGYKTGTLISNYLSNYFNFNALDKQINDIWIISSIAVKYNKNW